MKIEDFLLFCIQVSKETYQNSGEKGVRNKENTREKFERWKERERERKRVCVEV